MSGIPGFASPWAQRVLSVALWLENGYRRRRGMNLLSRNSVIRLEVNGSAYNASRLPIQGHLGGADVRLSIDSPGMDVATASRIVRDAVERDRARIKRQPRG